MDYFQEMLVDYFYNLLCVLLLHSYLMEVDFYYFMWVVDYYYFHASREEIMFQEVDFSLKKKKRCTIAWNGLIPASTLLLYISCYCILDNQI